MLTIVLVVVAFIVGAVVGAANASTVSNAIATVQSAEKRAKNTIDTIAAHKAS